MQLREFLLHHTNTNDVCYITECGYNLAMCFIDSEDLFTSGMNDEVLDKEVVETCNTTLQGINVLHIEVK